MEKKSSKDIKAAKKAEEAQRLKALEQNWNKKGKSQQKPKPTTSVVQSKTNSNLTNLKSKNKAAAAPKVPVALEKKIKALYIKFTVKKPKEFILTFGDKNFGPKILTLRKAYKDYEYKRDSKSLNNLVASFKDVITQLEKTNFHEKLKKNANIRTQEIKSAFNDIVKTQNLIQDFTNKISKYEESYKQISEALPKYYHSNILRERDLIHAYEQFMASAQELKKLQPEKTEEINLREQYIKNEVETILRLSKEPDLLSQDEELIDSNKFSVNLNDPIKKVDAKCQEFASYLAKCKTGQETYSPNIANKFLTEIRSAKNINQNQIEHYIRTAELLNNEYLLSTINNSSNTPNAEEEYNLLEIEEELLLSPLEMEDFEDTIDLFSSHQENSLLESLKDTVVSENLQPQIQEFVNAVTKFHEEASALRSEAAYMPNKPRSMDLDTILARNKNNPQLFKNLYTLYEFTHNNPNTFSLAEQQELELLKKATETAGKKYFPTLLKEKLHEVFNKKIDYAKKSEITDYEKTLLENDKTQHKTNITQLKSDLHAADVTIAARIEARKRRAKPADSNTELANLNKKIIEATEALNTNPKDYLKYEMMVKNIFEPAFAALPDTTKNKEALNILQTSIENAKQKSQDKENTFKTHVTKHEANLKNQISESKIESEKEKILKEYREPQQRFTLFKEQLEETSNTIENRIKKRKAAAETKSFKPNEKKDEVSKTELNQHPSPKK